MKLKEHNFTFDGIDVQYKFRSAKSDRKALLVIFSGFRPVGSKYDFDGTGADSLNANILWIKDSFSEKTTYYIRDSTGYGVANAVQELIAKIAGELGLEEKHCILAGFSKGGSGALYHGLKYNFRNIITTVPRMNIGTANHAANPDILRGMLADVSDETIKELDSLIPNLLKSDLNRHRNIYLISSVQDEQFKTEIQPFLTYYELYSNFNLILTESPLVTTHTDVTRYNLPSIYALIALLTEGFAPRLGKNRNGYHSFKSALPQPQLEATQHRNEITGFLSELTFSGGKLHAAGHAIIPGRDSRGKDTDGTSLILESKEEKHKLDLIIKRNIHLNTKYFRNVFCDYSWDGFSSVDIQQNSLDQIADGKYAVTIEKVCGDETYHIDNVQTPQRSSSQISGTSVLQIVPDGKSSYLIKRPILNFSRTDLYFTLNGHWVRNGQLHIEGYFIVPGSQVPQYDSVKYYIIIESTETNRYSFIRPLAIGNRVNAGQFIGDAFLDYSKAYYTTKNYAGIDYSALPHGEFHISVSAIIEHSIVSHEVPLKLNISTNNEATFQPRVLL